MSAQIAAIVERKLPYLLKTSTRNAYVVVYHYRQCLVVASVCVAVGRQCAGKRPPFAAMCSRLGRVDATTDRHVRYMRREARRHQKEDDVCAYCLESTAADMEKVCSTWCGHRFHKACVLQHQDSELETGMVVADLLASPAVVADDDLAQKVLLLRHFAGRVCVVCRSPHPFVHLFAAQVAARTTLRSLSYCGGGGIVADMLLPRSTLLQYSHTALHA